MKESSLNGTGGTPPQIENVVAAHVVSLEPTAMIPAPTPDPMYTALMQRLDAMEKNMRREPEIKKKKKAPRKVSQRADTYMDREEPIREISPEPVSNDKPQFRIQGSPTIASRQLMEHLHSQRMERVSARARMYQNFLPL